MPATEEAPKITDTGSSGEANRQNTLIKSKADLAVMCSINKFSMVSKWNGSVRDLQMKSHVMLNIYQRTRFI